MDYIEKTNKGMNFFQLKKFSEKVCKNIIYSKLNKLNNFNLADLKSKILSSLLSIFQEKFYAIAFDFDGTLIPIEKRDQIVEPYIINKLKHINKKKIPIFILTGRGNSILRQFPLKKFPYERCILIAQYNGGKILLGDQTKIFEKKIKKLNGYKEIKEFLENIDIKFNEKNSGFVCFYSNDLFNDCASFISKYNDWKIYNTNFSFDILPKEISKYSALELGCKCFNIDDLSSILKIGDSGDLFGNDYDILNLKNSFSVGEFSANINTNFPIIDENNNVLKGPSGIKFILDNIKFCDSK